MNKLFYLISSIIIILGVISCNSAKNVAYIQGAGENDMAGYVQTSPMYDARILPKDLLTITVSATDPEAVKPFNLTVPSLTTGSSTYSQPALQKYLVDNNGQINFPVLGMVTLSGLTKREAETKITGLLQKYLNVGGAQDCRDGGGVSRGACSAQSPRARQHRGFFGSRIRDTVLYHL